MFLPKRFHGDPNFPYDPRKLLDLGYVLYCETFDSKIYKENNEYWYEHPSRFREPLAGGEEGLFEYDVSWSVERYPLHFCKRSKRI